MFVTFSFVDISNKIYKSYIFLNKKSYNCLKQKFLDVIIYHIKSSNVLPYQF